MPGLVSVQPVNMLPCQRRVERVELWWLVGDLRQRHESGAAVVLESRPLVWWEQLRGLVLDDVEQLLPECVQRRLDGLGLVEYVVCDANGLGYSLAVVHEHVWRHGLRRGQHIVADAGERRNLLQR